MLYSFIWQIEAGSRYFSSLENSHAYVYVGVLCVAVTGCLARLYYYLSKGETLMS